MTRAAHTSFIARGCQRLAAQRRSSTWRGISLVEVMLGVMLLAVGLVAIASLFPAGIAQQRRSVDDSIGPIVASNAMAIIRSKVSSSDFGVFEDFGVDAPIFTVEGDWPWIRPTLLLNDDNSTPDVDELGAIDIFGALGTTLASASEFRGPHPDVTNGEQLLGIPPALRDRFNSASFFDYGPVLITQGERRYPMRDPNDADSDLPQYHWDCMFRRFEGRILVAIFVYRVGMAAGERAEYISPVDSAGRPAVPTHLDLAGFHTHGGGQIWPTPPGALAQVWQFNDEYVRGTSGTPDNLDQDGQPAGPADEDDIFLSWQSTGQWIIDQNNNVHRVLSGRSESADDGVQLKTRVPLLPDSQAYWQDISTGASVWDIWYVPRRVSLGADVSATLTPVYVTVKEL